VFKSPLPGPPRHPTSSHRNRPKFRFPSPIKYVLAQVVRPLTLTICDPYSPPHTNGPKFSQHFFVEIDTPPSAFFFQSYDTPPHLLLALSFLAFLLSFPHLRSVLSHNGCLAQNLSPRLPFPAGTLVPAFASPVFFKTICPISFPSFFRFFVERWLLVRINGLFLSIFAQVRNLKTLPKDRAAVARRHYVISF